MSRLSIVSKGGGHWLIHGELTFASIQRKWVEQPPFLVRAGKDIFLDFSQVTSTDSAGLALMLEWIKLSRHKRTQLHFRNIPTQLTQLAKLTGLDKTRYFTHPPLKLKKPLQDVQQFVSQPSVSQTSISQPPIA